MPRYYCFTDIEGTGDNPATSKILAIASVCIKIPDKIPENFTSPEYVDEFMISLKTEESDFEEDCKNNFWMRSDDLKALKERLMKNAIDRKDGLLAFVTWLDKMRKKYQPLIIVSDNKVYDFGRINYELAQLLGLHPCTYMKTASGRYIQCGDLDFADWLNGLAFGMGLVGIGKPRFGKPDMKKLLYDKFGDQINFKYSHTHDPLDDAKNLAELFWFTIIMINKSISKC